MIQISIRKKEGKTLSIAVIGHAGAGPYGADLVCAGVSACYCGAVNALDNKSGNISEKHQEGNGKIEVRGPISDHDEIVLGVLEEQLLFLSQDNKEFITIKKS